MKTLNVENKIVLVDDEDYDKVKDLPWRIEYYGYVVYGYRDNGKLKVVRMHRLLLGLTDEKIQVDHENWNKLDNRKKNLRLATVQQNDFNRPKYMKGFGHNYKGVNTGSFTTWGAHICVNNRGINLGRYATKEEAAYAYNVAALHVAKEFAYLNKVTIEDEQKRLAIEDKVKRKLAQYGH